MTKYFNQIWQVNFSKKAEKAFDKIAPEIRKQINKFLDSKIVNQPNPRVIGKQLIGNHKDKWSYRIGDYRLLVQIQDEKFIILAIDVGHRKEIYKKF